MTSTATASTGTADHRCDDLRRFLFGVDEPIARARVDAGDDRDVGDVERRRRRKRRSALAEHPPPDVALRSEERRAGRVDRRIEHRELPRDVGLLGEEEDARRAVVDPCRDRREQLEELVRDLLAHGAPDAGEERDERRTPAMRRDPRNQLAGEVGGAGTDVGGDGFVGDVDAERGLERPEQATVGR